MAETINEEEYLQIKNDRDAMKAKLDQAFAETGGEGIVFQTYHKAWKLFSAQYKKATSLVVESEERENRRTLSEKRKERLAAKASA
ncbi:MAG TPA: hypothetical protein VKR06_37155 [Ktedonosporobacter sp.]|nr:hypothetical protein [Ktedonosporobacter sp.]